MAATVLKAGALASLCVILIALFVRKHLDETLKDRLTSVLQGLVEVEQKHSIEAIRRVAVGYGGCHDLFVNAEDLLEFQDAARDPQHFNSIKTYEELLKTYAYFFRHGAAAERFVQNDTLFYELVEKASFMPGARFALGGNAPVMASRFLQEGCDVLLGAQVSDQLAKRLPDGIKSVPGMPEREDIHLIMEYKTDEEWGMYTSPRANRFIVHSDSVNPMVSVVEEFEPLLQKFQPHLFVVGGLQMMDNFPYSEGQRRERLSRVRDQMVSLSDETRIHFEMASFTEELLIRELIQYVLPFADSLGTNEQELANLHHILMYGNVSLVSDSNPRVAVVLDQMRHVFKLVRELGLATPRARPLTRLHVHTLAYQAIVTVVGSPWKNSKAAAAKASLTANRHVCGSPEVDVEKALLIMDESFSTSVSPSVARRVPLDEKAPVSCWEERWPLDGRLSTAPGAATESADVLHVQICIAPVLVCTEAQQTCGGGDNISSAGLVLQI